MILSVSRRSDIPAFYSEWFYRRIEEGYLELRNPYNPEHITKVFLNSENIDCIVFWTKDPANFLPGLYKLKDFKFYFQFTVTPYDSAIETNVRDKKKILGTFIELSDIVGKERMIWRYDPVLYSDEIGKDYHILHFTEMAETLSSHTDKCIISFFDYYRKCKRKLKGTSIRELNDDEIFELISRIGHVAERNEIKLETCAERIDLSRFNIGHASCIDPDLIQKLTGRRINLKKDRNQRELCGCAESFDIGTYNTCRHGCRYCYAN